MMSVYGKEGRYKAKQSTMKRNCRKKTKKIFGLNEKGNRLLYIPSQGIWKAGNSNTNQLRKGWHGGYCGVRQVIWSPPRVR
ncbi:hypothetical protein Bca4012_054494 [Brassica carinata]|uniref:Uncharacterized protein n=1 Tax=Brassica carinata TaxID=52824 RepID=A0A8X7VXN2_BRACI|nr:hypothetical protein Bca52824_012445 [Brassica carinata]